MSDLSPATTSTPNPSEAGHQQPEFRRQHPVAAISKTLSYIRENLVTVIVGVVIGTRNTDMTFAFFIVAGVALILASGIASWWRFQFRVLGDEIQMVSGVFVRKKLYLTKDRIQVIDISAGIVQRMFGLVRLDIQTAGSSSRAAAIDAITLKEAEEIQRQLRSESERAAAKPATHSEAGLGTAASGTISSGTNTSGTDKTQVNTPGTDKKGIYPLESHPQLGSFEGSSTPEAYGQAYGHTYRLPGKDLLIAASTSGRFGIILSIMAAIYGQLQPVIYDAEWLDRMFSLLPAQTGPAYYINIALLFVLLAWLVSFFSTIINYSDFSVRVQAKELIITRGLFEKKRVTVPKDRIQSVYLQEGLMRQPFGLLSVHLNTAAYGDDKGGGNVQLFPLLNRRKTGRLLQTLLPDYHISLPVQNPPLRSLRRYVFRASMLPLLIAAAIYYVIHETASGYGASALILLPLFAALWGWIRYRDAAIGWSETHLILRERTLARTTAILEFRRIQDITLSQTFFQRLRDLCTVRVHIASGDRGRSFACKDLRTDTGLELLSHFRKGKSRSRPEVPAGRTIFLPVEPT